MSESEIRVLIESTKIRKTVNENLLSIGRKRDKEFKKLENDILNLKKEYGKKLKSCKTV